jgi:hypothetical protein
MLRVGLGLSSLATQGGRDSAHHELHGVYALISIVYHLGASISIRQLSQCGHSKIS